jgi:integrase
MICGLDVFCGLRASEIAELKIGDVDIVAQDGVEPVIRVRRETTKSDAGVRAVPMDWNARFLQDVRDYFIFRFGADWETRRDELAHLPFVVSFRRHCVVPIRAPQTLFSFATGETHRVVECAQRHLHRNTIRKYFITAAATAVDVKRVRVTTHTGRHTFCSLALEVKRTPAKVMEAAGHSDLKITSIYSHRMRDLSDVDCMASIYANTAT